MALINCPECGKEISDTVQACPHCGFSFTNSPTPKKKKHTALVIILAVIILLAGAAVGGYFWYNSSKPWISNVDNSVVKVNCYDSHNMLIATGSGFIYGDSQTLVTNYHVIDGAFKASIETNTNESFAVDYVINLSGSDDIALLHLSSDTKLLPLKGGDINSIKKGDPVIAIGCPVGLQNVVSDGVISGTTKDDYLGSLRFTASISHGSSGGALFNKRGEVIGVTYGSDESGQTLNYAVPIDKVNMLMDAKAINASLESVVETMNPEAFEAASSVKVKIGYATITIPYEWSLYNKLPESNEIPLKDNLAEQYFKMDDYEVFVNDYVFDEFDGDPADNLIAYIEYFGRDINSYSLADTDDGKGVIAYTVNEEEWDGKDYTFKEILIGGKNSCLLMGVRYQTIYQNSDMDKQIEKIAKSTQFD